MKKIEYYHKNSDVIAYEKIINEDGCWFEKTYNERGRVLTYKDSDGYWEERTYDEKGNELTYKDSYGNYRIRGRKVIKEKFEAFVNSLENPLLSKIAELEKQLDELKKLVK